MSDEAVVFDRVAKRYSLGLHHAGGLKNLILHFPAQLKLMRSAYYEVFHDLSFAIARGESFGIIGRNGAGKSTLLGLIAGVIRPTQGHVRVSGRVSPMLELGAGFQPELSGLDNILLNGVLLGLPKRLVEQRTDQIVAFSELGPFIEQPIRSYSSGMLMRLGFSVLVHLDPEILVIDEIMAVGDADFQAKCKRKMQEFKDAGVTIILVSHNMNDIATLCDRAALIENKSLRAIGLPSDVIGTYMQQDDRAGGPACD